MFGMAPPVFGSEKRLPILIQAKAEIAAALLDQSRANLAATTEFRTPEPEKFRTRLAAAEETRDSTRVRRAHAFSADVAEGA